MTPHDGRKLINSAVLLTVAALLSKVLSIGYRIPYQNITGDIGYYVYQQVYPFYGIAFILAMYGFPVVISKLVSERVSVGDQQGASHVLRISFWLLGSIGMMCFVILYFAAPFIAQMVGDTQLEAAYRAISFPFLFIPFISVLRGMFQAEEDMIPTATSQIVEQIARVVVIVCLSVFLMSSGYGVYAAGTGAAFGSTAGAAASLLVLLIFLWKRKKDRRTSTGKLHRAAKKKIAKQLLFEGFTISISSLVLVLFQVIDAFTVFNQLTAYGLSDAEAKIAKGVFDRGQPLLQLGSTVATSLSLVIVPLIVKATVKGNVQEANLKAGFAIKLSFVFSLAASIGLFTIIEPTNVMLFTDNSGSMLLAFLGLAILFHSLTLTAVAVLQGIGKVPLILFVIGLGLAIKAIVNLFLIRVYGIGFAAVATVAGFATMAALSLFFIHHKLKLFQLYRFRWLRIFAAVSGMAVVTLFWKNHVESFIIKVVGSGRLASMTVALSSLLVAVTVYMSLLYFFRVFTKNELAYFPKFNQFAPKQNK